MSGLANLLNVPASEQEWMVWSFSNMDHHRQIIRAIGAQKNVDLNLYILDPIPFFSLLTWLEQHQQTHNDMDGVLGIAGFDLSGLDVNNPGQVAAWVKLHWQEHQLAAQQLGVG
jgi:hypothetical protein